MTELNAETPYVAFERTAFAYDAESPVFADLNLTVRPGEYVALLGGNGTGKSTIAKLIDALVQPHGGRVLVFGADTRDGARTFFIRSNTGLVFQNPDDQLVASIIENEVAFGPENMGVPAPELRRRVDEALTAVGLQGFQEQETAALSGGQKQRVAIAGALAMEPALMIFDEATAMLDPRGRESLLRLIDQLHESGITVVTITHYMDEAARASRVVVLEGSAEGATVALDGTPDEVFAQAERLTKLGLALPFPSELALDLRKAGASVTPTVSEDALVEQLAGMRKADDAVLAGHTITPPASQTQPNRDGDIGLDDSRNPIAPSPLGYGEALIVFEGVSFAYGNPDGKRKSTASGAQPQAWGNLPGEAFALRDVNLAVHRGEMLGLAGHTGSGKSTLIQHMNGLLHATAGRVLIGGRDLADKAVAREARRHVGLVFQYPEHQLFAATVYDDVAFGPRNLGLSPDEVDARARRALSQVDLPPEEFAARSPFELSGGQQRKAALAGILAMEPQVLVMDEPAAGLDPRTRADFLALVRELHEGGLTVVMASHAMEDLARLCDRIVVLDQGTIVLDGPPLDVFENAEPLERAGLAQPAPLRAAARLRAAGFALPRRLYDARTLAEAIAPQLDHQGR